MTNKREPGAEGWSDTTEPLQLRQGRGSIKNGQSMWAKKLGATLSKGLKAKHKKKIHTKAKLMTYIPASQNITAAA